MEGVTFLTDPVLHSRCSPLTFAGPKARSRHFASRNLQNDAADAAMRGATQRVVPPALDLFDPRCPKVRRCRVSYSPASRLIRVSCSLYQPDFVVISHSHYDHLCSRSVEDLRARFGAGGALAVAAKAAGAAASKPLHWYVPLGMAAWFHDAGVAEVTELDWWEEAEHKGVHVACTPAQHWSARTPFDKNTTLWSSW